jgi:hypothetical protein
MTKVMKPVFRYFKILIILIALPAIWFTYVYVVRPRVFASSGTEVERLESPDHEVQAVVIETNPGALEPFYYAVHLAKIGSKSFGNPVLDAFGKNDLKLRWISARLLEISYSDACIGSFHNHWESMELQKRKLRRRDSFEASPRLHLALALCMTAQRTCFPAATATL